MRSDFEDELASGEIMRATRLEAKYKFYFRRFAPDVILTLKFRRVRYVGPARLLKEINERMRELEAAVQHTVGWAVVIDRGLSGRLLRFHLLISGTADLQGYRGWEFRVPHECTRRRVTWRDSRGTARFLAKLGITENNRFQFGGSLIEDDPHTPDEMRQNTVNPALKKVVERDFIALGADPECKRMPLQIFIEARGCDEDGRGSGYGYVIANTGATQIEWHDGWSRDEAFYQAIRRGIEDVPPAVEMVFLVESRAVVNYFENDAPGRKHREMLRFLARTRLRIQERGLTVTVERVPRKRNLARHLLDDPIPEGDQD